MLKTLWTGRSGLYANQQRLDIISNNMANMTTNGYKSVDVTFLDTFYESQNKLGVPLTSKNKENLIAGSGSKAAATFTDASEGVIEKTSRLSDMAISGSGLFKLKDEKGNVFYTRDGSFNLDKNGNFVHSSGCVLEVQNYNVAGLKEKYKIDEKGTLYSEDKQIGKIKVYDFVDNDNLVPVGNNLFVSSSKPIESKATIMQEHVEHSNVEFGKEIINMTMTQRAYELNSKSIKAADEMWQIANNLRSK